MSDHMKDSEVNTLKIFIWYIECCWQLFYFSLIFQLQEPSNKRVKPVTKSNSLTGVITPVKTPALKRIGQSISVKSRILDTQKMLCY